MIQDLFVWLLSNPSRVKNINNIEVYLFKSLKRNLLRYLTNHDRLHGYSAQDAEETEVNIEESIIQQEAHDYRRKLLSKKLEKLPSKQKEVIYLRYYEGLTYDEIAEILSTTNQVVRNYVSRALAQLRKAIGPIN